MRIIAATALAIVVASSVPAQAEQLEGDRLQSFISGKTVRLSTPYGLELPLRYGTGGAVSGDLSGFTLARMFAPRETGRWWVDGARLCQQWPSWYDGETLCFTVRRTGDATISWVREDGLEGTARVEG